MRVYQYGISAVHDEPAVVAQMLAGHRYQNKLVEIECARRDARNLLAATRLRPGLEERLQAIEAELETLAAQARKANSEARSKASSDKSALKAAMKPLKEERQVLRRERREALRQIREDETLQDQFAAIDQAANAAVKAARAETEAYWGTYLLAEDAMKAAKKEPELRFHRWDGEGSVGVQIQGGMLTSDVFGADTRIRVEPVPDAWRGSRGERRKACITTLWLRIGSQGPRNTEPIWARFRVHLHRPLPTGLVKRVNVHRRRIGARFRWFVDFVVDCSRQHPDTVGPDSAIDIGWRKMESGLRVAMLRHAGGDEELVLPQEFLDRLRKVRDLRSIRDTNFNAIIKRLRGWIADRDVPDWMREAYAHMHAWRSYSRLVVLARTWAAERIPGDEEVFAGVEAWRRQDKHLWDWEANQHKRTLLCRREIYRCWAADVCSRFSRVFIEAFDLREVAERKPVEEDTGEDAATRVYRHDAALSELRKALADAAAARGVAIVPLDPAWTTRTCHACGAVDYAFDAAKKLVNTCGCGCAWDQDVNAAINLLASGSGLKEYPVALATV